MRDFTGAATAMQQTLANTWAGSRTWPKAMSERKPSGVTAAQPSRTAQVSEPGVVSLRASQQPSHVCSISSMPPRAQRRAFAPPSTIHVS